MDEIINFLKIYNYILGKGETYFYSKAKKIKL